MWRNGHTVHFFSHFSLIIFGRFLTLTMKLKLSASSVAPNAYGGAYTRLDPSYPPHMPSANGYVDMYGRSQVVMAPVVSGDSQLSHSIDHGSAPAGTSAGVAAPIGSNAAWETRFDPSIPRR